ncbi:efflux transporter outer membrane subunit [Desulfovibrio cuneatus]|uniref:efflux transporter outer membrane subunit n=1 Tax=Desulfovibrio cuneatus TaxID=159728 RepID=UPI0004084304|nr:efflux transporter outer membrane subunit [Desulfovibrio cuneatus]
MSNGFALGHAVAPTPACAASPMRPVRQKAPFAPLALALLAASLAGCTMAPKYQRPPAPIPNTYVYGSTAEGTLPAWKNYFNDPALQGLISLALANNRDLRVAMLHVEKTRQQYRIRQADLLPTINGVAQETVQSLPADLSPTHTSTITRQYSATLGFSAFELDLFGRIRSLSDQAVETHYSVEQDARTAQLTLVAEVAGLYYQLVADKETLGLMQATMQNREQHLGLMQKRNATGVASAMDLSQAKVAYEEARSGLARAKTTVAKTENALALLLGTSIPANVNLPASFADAKKLPNVPAGLPSSLMERRPDILAAEHRLKGSNANIGAARANFFPRIMLTGALGTMSTEYTNLFTGVQQGWNFLPQISMPLFDTGRNIATLGVAGEEKKIAVAQYEKTIQAAFREVADALAQRQEMGTIISAEEERAKAARQNFDLANERYKAGVDNHLVLLDAQRTYLASRQNLIATYLLRESNNLSLYKSLGGGWQ